MSYIVIVRAFKPGDEIGCKELIRNSVMSSLGATFRGMLFKEITFQLIILLSAIMFIFFGMPLTICLVVIPLVVILVYVGTYISFAAKLAEINEEVTNIPRLYMSNGFSCFWVAEAFQPYLMTRHPKEVHYTVITEQQYCQANMGVSLQAKKIVGTICLSKSYRLDKCAWIKRLCVHEQYQNKGFHTQLASIMPTKKGEQWYADWIVAADVCMDLPESFQKNKNEVLLRLDKLLLQQGDELEQAADRRHFTARKRGGSRTRYKKATNLRRRVNTLSHPAAPPYGRYSDYYHSSIDLTNPPYEASSLPALSRAVVDVDDNETRLSLEQQVRNEQGNLRSSVRKLSPLGNFIKQHLVRSRSLTQLDALSSSMLDTGEHHLESDSSQQQPHHLHQHQQPHQLQHHPLSFECNRIRFLAPGAAPVEIVHPNRTRHKLSRSQVSSNEYFSVSFEVGDDIAAASFEREEFLPATRGTYLVDVLNPVCERRGIDLSRVEVLDSSSTPLSLLTTDASTLGGKHLRVTFKDERSNSRTSSQRGNQNVLLRKTSGNYRSRSGRFFSVSTEDTNVDSEVGACPTLASGRSSAGAAGLKTSKQRWSGFFTNTKGIKMDLLTAQLDEYNKHGVPKPANIHFQCDHTINEEALYSLEDDWRNIVENSHLLSEKQTQQQTALWELAETEVAYIKTLKVVTDLFMACLCSLQASNILNEVDRSKLFSNIPDIYAANRYFWTEYLLTMVNASRSSGQPLDPGHLLLGFETFEQTFAPYTRYCAEQSKCQQYCKDRLNDNQLFTAYLVWCETQKDCNRLKLMDILVMPMQRLTRYSLLLKAVYKNTENEEQRAELVHMIKSVDGFVASVNAALRRNEEAAQLDSAASRLESYDVVESKGLDEEVEKLIKLYSNLDITTVPMPGCPKDSLRTLLREGDLKLRDATSKMEVHVLLLTDMLLICKPTTKKMFKIIRQPYVVDRIRIHEVKEPSSLGLVYLNEYGTVSAALILSAGDPKLAKSWMESLRHAQQQFVLMKVPSLGTEPVMNLATVSRQPSTLGDGDFEVEECEGNFPRTPRGSSRASHVSSLAHSHSGSMEMEGVSPGSSSFLPSYNPSRNVSVETNEQPRASSSLSSEEGGESTSGHNHRLHIRRSLLGKSPTPNTLSVQVPYSSLGQSLPNLTLATSPQTSTVSPTPPNSLLIVPQMTKSKDTLLSPGHRGISYPPPSPPRGALRRAFALPQSRNPPLIKTRHVNASLTQPVMQTTTIGNSDTEVIEERRRRLDPSQRVPSTSSVVEEKK